MLCVDLVLAVLLLVSSNIAVYTSTNPLRYTAVLGGLFAGGPILLQFGAVPIWGLAIALFLLVAVLAALRRKRLFLPLSLFAAVVVFGGCAWWAWSDVERLKAIYPYESVNDQLPERPPIQTTLPPAMERNVTTQEEEVDRFGAFFRFHLLEELHENTLHAFINRPGFGVARMISEAEWYVRSGYRGGPPIAQPGPRSPSAGTWDEVCEPMTADDRLRGLHAESTLDFVHPGGFGYVRDRRHVAGFQSHQFSQEPKAEHWKLQSLDLVGLVVHAKPVAYMSENLPRMDELRDAPTRELNAFESAGLVALRGGEDLYARKMSDGGVRMLGAVRSLKQCLSCHGGGRGDLLGAFSYELRRDEEK